MFGDTRNTLRKFIDFCNGFIKFIDFYKGFIKKDIQRKKYKKVIKLFGGITKFILFKKPYVLIVETGTICNLDCPTCPTPREIVVGARTAKNMDLDTFKKIIDNSYKSFSAVLLYWSNEPLMNKDIAEMVRYCNSLNLYTFISTNVMLLNDKITRQLIDAGLDEMLLCLDGFSSATYERFRKGAKFETVKRNIETICRVKKESNAANPWIEIQYVETKQNAQEISSCREWAKDIGVDGFRVQPLYITKHLSDFVKLRDEFYTEESWRERRERDSAKRVCRNADSTVCVLVNGQPTICCYDIRGDYSFGNLLVDSFKSIEKNQKYMEIKKKGKRRELGICRKC